MSDDENFVADRRGIKRAHESPQKINLDVGDECSIESDDYPEDWDEHFHNKTAEAETPQLEEEEADPETIYPEHHEHHLEKAAFLFRELLADDKEIITKYNGAGGAGLYFMDSAVLVVTQDGSARTISM